MGARLAAIKNDPPPALLQLAWLAEKWGVEAVLGSPPDFFTITQMTKLMRIYDVFKRSVQKGGAKTLSAEDKQLMGEIMALGTKV